jgi:hypothetical protein
LNDKRKVLLICAVVITIICLVGLVVTDAMFEWSNDKFTASLLHQTPFVEGGVKHPWHIASMEGYTVELYNGSSYIVHSDWWDSCEHNPEQGHLIGIGWTNKTAFDERVRLDMDFMTRNYTATFETIFWVNSTMVKNVLFEAWS